MNPVIIDVVADVVCPWCYLGKARLDRALSEIGTEVAATVRWRPYQLDPTIPRSGISRAEYIRAKFGDSRRLEAAHERLIAMGADMGIAFRFDAITRSPNTIDAHRVIHWAGEAGVQNAVVTRLFELEFTEGADLGDHRILAAAAASAGMDETEVLRKLAAGDDDALVRTAAQNWIDRGVTGVPCFVLDGRYAVMGAQEVETLIGAIRQVAAEAAAA